MNEGIGDRYQQETKYTPESLKGHFLDWDNQPEQYKVYDNALSAVSLPEPDLPGAVNIWEIIARRRSKRVYDDSKTVSLSTLSNLLWATQGLTARAGRFFFRSAPSAGALYPVETYLMVRAVGDIEPGIYHFRPYNFDLELLKKGDFSKDLSLIALSQGMVTKAQLTFVWTAVTERAKWKYRQRAYRYIYLDAGHIAENLMLASEALGLGSCAIGAFFDDMANDLIGIDGKDETVIYMATAGYVKQKITN